MNFFWWKRNKRKSYLDFIDELATKGKIHIGDIEKNSKMSSGAPWGWGSQPFTVWNPGKRGKIVVKPRRKIPLSVRNRRLINRVVKDKEWKFKDQATTGSCPETGSFYHLASIAGGDEEQQREGEEVTIGSVSIKYRITANATKAEEQAVRVIMFIDWYGRVDPTLNTVAVTDLITSGGTVILQHFNQDNRKRYTILLDKIYQVGDALTTDGEQQLNIRTSVYDRYFKKKKWKMSFTGTTGTSRGKGALWIVFIGDTNTNTATYALDSRIYFQD